LNLAKITNNIFYCEHVFQFALKSFKISNLVIDNFGPHGKH